MINNLLDILDTEQKNICLITAHHDDEILFFGGLLSILSSKENINLYLITICDIKNENNGHDYIKKHINYKNICSILNIKYVELNLILNIKIIDELENINDQKNELTNKIKELNDKIKEINDKIKEINDKKKELNNKKNKLNDQKNKLNDKKNKLNDQKNKLNDQKNKLNDQKNELTNKIKELNDKKKNFINSFKITENCILNYDNICNILIKEIKNLNVKFDIIFTHNNLGEYGHIDHKIVNYIVSSLKCNIFNDIPIYSTANNITDMKIKINISQKQDLIKLYDFKDTNEKKCVWFNQTINNYQHWSNNDYEYFINV